MDTDQLTQRIIGCAIDVHQELGPGLLESIYESAMAVELDFQKMGFRQQVIVPIQYRGRLIGEHRIDLIVENTVVVELKSVERFDRVFRGTDFDLLEAHKAKNGPPNQFQFSTATRGHQEVCALTLLSLFLRAPAANPLFCLLCVSVPLWLILFLYA